MIRYLTKHQLIIEFFVVREVSKDGLTFMDPEYEIAEEYETERIMNQ